MILWIDAQLSPALAPWIAERFGVTAYSLKYLGLRDAEDRQIFEAARQVGAIVMTKDSDFVQLVQQHGPPPKILLISVGNTSNTRMKEVLEAQLLNAIELLRAGDSIVEIGDLPWA